MCLSKSCEGLGVRDIKNFNLALLCKWLWRWVSEERSLCVSIVKSKYKSLSHGSVHESSSKFWSLW